MEGLITLYGYVVSPSDYHTIVSFCEDVGITNVSDRKKMVLELSSAVGYHEKMPQVENTIYLMDDIRIVKTPSISGDGEILMIVGESPILEENSLEISKEFSTKGVEVLSEEPMIGVPLAPAGDISDSDLERLSFQLRDYLTDDRITFFELVTLYLSEEEYGALLDGKEMVV